MKITTSAYLLSAETISYPAKASREAGSFISISFVPTDSSDVLKGIYSGTLEIFDLQDYRNTTVSITMELKVVNNVLRLNISEIK